MEKLNELTRQIVMEFYDSGVSAIAPGEVAESVYARIDPERQAPLLVQASSKNDLRRRAEGALRNAFRDEEKRLEEGQEDAFSGHLQSFYPCEREGTCVYVAPVDMTDDEGMRNVERLRAEAGAKLKHADALEAYFLNRNRAVG